MAVLQVQPSLFGLAEPAHDDGFGSIERTELGAGAWIEYQSGWTDGHQTLFDQLLTSVDWQQHERPMYDRLVTVPRLTASVDDHDRQQRFPILDRMAHDLGQRYDQAFDRIGLALYRDGNDSVAWHGDQVARDRYQAVMATVSVGEPRPFRLRPKRGGPSRSLSLGHGDLVVMGGTCQRTWEHAVPKVARAGPRICIMFRPHWMS